VAPTGNVIFETDLPSVIFEVTSNCNLHCRYCYNIWKMPGVAPPKLNSYKQAKKTLKRLFRLAKVDHVAFTGGEPLLAERIEELILFARLKKKSVTLITNGTAADEDRYRTLVKLGVSLFEIPVHSAQPEIHDSMTKVDGSWKKAVESIRVLGSLGAEVVPVVVLTRLNAPYIEDTLSFIKGLDQKRIMLNRYNIGGEGLRENEHILLSHEELRKAYAIADRLGPSLELDLTSNVCTPFCLLNPKDYPHIAFGSCSTDPRQLPVTVDIRGNLRLCNHSPVVAGNIFKESLDRIFASAHVSGWLKHTPAFCSNCKLYDRCLGGCRAAALQMGLSSDEVDPVMTFRR
jgi:radical SAM protein with 4Fe4S-binding SPASM domain